jgi:hypothetical protein
MSIQPPPVLTELEDLRKLAPNFQQILLQEIMPLLIGRPFPRMPRREHERLNRKLERLMQSAAPYLLGIAACTGELSAPRACYALLEGLMRTLLRTGGVRVLPSEDSFQTLFRLRNQISDGCGPWTKTQAYLAAHSNVDLLIHYFINSAHGAALHNVQKEWFASDDVRELLQFGGQYSFHARRFRYSRPLRFTTRAIIQLADEYRLHASFLDQRLRLLIALNLAAEGRPESIANIRTKNLTSRLEARGIRDEVRLLAAALDRRVRNGLAHRIPDVDWNKKTCLFRDQDRVVELPMAEFFDVTKKLSITSLVLFQFEDLLCEARLRERVHQMWQQLRDNGATHVSKPSEAAAGPPPQKVTEAG